MGNMSQVQTAEILPATTDAEWDQAEMEFEDRAILLLIVSRATWRDRIEACAVGLT